MLNRNLFLHRFLSIVLAHGLMLGAAWAAKGEAAYIGLTDRNTIELFDADGKFLVSREIATPDQTDIGIAYGDVLPGAEYPGKELIILRDDLAVVELYGAPAVSADPLPRIAYNRLARPGGRTPLAIDVADVVDTNPGDEIVGLTAAASGPPFVDIYAGGSDTDNAGIARLANGFHDMSGSAHQPLAGVAIGELAANHVGPEVVTIAEDDWVEVYRLNGVLTGAGATRTQALSVGDATENDADVIGVKAVGDGTVRVMLRAPSHAADQRYRLVLLEPVDQDGHFTAQAVNTVFLEDNPEGRSTFVDFVITLTPEPD